MATVYRIALEATGWRGVKIVNTFHVKASDSAPLNPDPSADSTRDMALSAYRDKWKAILTTLDTFDGISVVEEVANPGHDIPQASFGTVGAAGTRTASDQFLSSGLCILAKISTNAAIRSGHGRMWLPPALTSSAAAGTGTWASGNVYWTLTQTFLNAVTATQTPGGIFGTQTFEPVVYSRVRRARGEANYYFGITGYTMHTDQRFLRSRVTIP